MSDLSSSSASGNLPEFTVSELSQAVKRTIEGTFERVRVRGEVSGFKRAASGHLYLALKDEDAVLDAVCWRGLAGRLALQPEDGMEVIAIGRLTTYPGRSKYQIVIEQLELAGEGALLKLLEERRRKLADFGAVSGGEERDAAAAERDCCELAVRGDSDGASRRPLILRLLLRPSRR